jgi:glutathione S-transferase
MAGMSFGVNKEADYLAMNPNGLVPLLRDDETDATLWESNTIVRYLAAVRSGRLWVENPARAPRVKSGWTGRTRRYPQPTA